MKQFFLKLKDTFIGRFFRILWISGKRYGADGHGARAVALTYYTLFAIVPVAALLFGIAKGFDLDEKLRATLTERFAHQQQLLQYVYQFADTTLKHLLLCHRSAPEPLCLFPGKGPSPLPSSHPRPPVSLSR